MKAPLNSSSPERRPSGDNAIAAAAADWVARRDLGLTKTEEKEFAQWASDERNREALARTSRLWSLLERPREAGKAEGMVRELELRGARRRRRRRLGGIGAIAGAAALFAWLGLPARKPPAAPVVAAVAEIRQQKLSDGSTVDLKAGAAIEVQFSPGVRRVNLVRGEALFHVSKNPARPFVVAAGGVEARAVGTAFAVRFDPEEVEVLVTEGRVAVGRPAGLSGAAPAMAQSLAIVDAGNHVVVSRKPETAFAAPPAVEAVSAAEIDRRLAWRYPHLEFSGIHLDEAVALFNRHSEANGGTRLVIGDAELATVEVSGYFRASNVDGFVRLLEGSFGVTAERGPDGAIVLHRAR